MGETHFSGPVIGESGVKSGDGGTTFSEVKEYTATIDPSAVSADSVASEEFTVTGLLENDVVVVNAGADDIGIGNVRVSADDTLKVTFINPTSSQIDPASSDWSIIAFRN
jgi:hypothetical protein